MPWTDPAGHVYVDGETPSAAIFNPYIQANLAHLYACSSAGVVRVTLGDVGVDLSTTSQAMVEIHANLRTTVVVPSTGRVKVTQCLVYQVATAADVAIGTAVFGQPATWTDNAWSNSTNVNTFDHVIGSNILTGYPAGLTTFVYGWKTCCSSQQVVCNSHTRSAVANGTWIIMEPLP